MLSIKRGLLILFIILLTGCNAKQELQIEEGKTNMNEQFLSAVGEGNEERVVELLNDGANVNAVNEVGSTAVMIATETNQPKMVQYLIDHGANINQRNDRLDNVLLYASAEGLYEIVEIAVQAGADTTITNRFGGTALIPAADRGHVDIVKFLLKESDVAIDHINDLHWTALLEAVILGDGGEKHQQIVRLLLEHGADVSITDRDGVTALEHAEKRGFKEMENMLRQ